MSGPVLGGGPVGAAAPRTTIERTAKAQFADASELVRSLTVEHERLAAGALAGTVPEDHLAEVEAELDAAQKVLRRARAAAVYLRVA